MLNQGLVLISPVILVRLLTVEEFGRYREFLLYAGVLTTICAFGINNSLLYFIPSRPKDTRQLLWQCTTMTVVGSVLVVGVALLANELTGGAVLGDMALAVALYVLLFVNLDFWEFYWLAERRALPVLAYTTGRLITRMVVVIVAASLSSDVQVIVWSLIVLEALRLAASAVMWRREWQRGEAAPPGEACWREQLQYCVPIGLALILVTLNKSIGNLFLAKAMGAVALAHYAIGTQVQPIVTVLRNSMSDAVLPEMAAARLGPAEQALQLWHRATVLSMVLLLPAAAVLMEFAHPIVTTLFSAAYEPAVPVFQIFLLVLLREVFDFGVALRALNRNAPIVHSNLLAIVINAVLLAIFVPAYGLIGAAVAFVVSRYVEGVYLGWRTLRAYGIGMRRLASWSELARIALAAIVASGVFYGSFWMDQFGLAGVALGTIAYCVVFLALLLVCRVPEILLLMRRLERKSLTA